MMNFKVTKSDIIFRGRVFDLKVDQIEYTSGNKGVRETAVHAGGAVIVPFTNEKKIRASVFTWTITDRRNTHTIKKKKRFNRSICCCFETALYYTRME